MKLSFLGRKKRTESSGAEAPMASGGASRNGHVKRSANPQTSESSISFFHNLYQYAFTQKKQMEVLRKSNADNGLREIEATRFKNQGGFMSYSPSNKVPSSKHSLLVATSMGNPTSTQTPSPFTIQDNMTSTATYDDSETVSSSAYGHGIAATHIRRSISPQLSHRSNSIKEGDDITGLMSNHTVNESLYQLHRQQQLNKEVTKRSIELERFESMQANSFKEEVGFISHSPSVQMSMSPAKRRSVESGGKESFQQSLYQHDIEWKEAVDKKREDIRQSIAREKAADDDLNCTYQPKLETEVYNSNLLNVTSHSSRDDCLIEKHSVKDVYAYKMAKLRAKYEKECNESCTFTPNKGKRERQSRRKSSSDLFDGSHHGKSIFEKLYQQPLKKSSAAQDAEPNPDFTFKPTISQTLCARVYHERTVGSAAEQFERLHRNNISNIRIAASDNASKKDNKKNITKDAENEMVDRLTRRDVARRKRASEFGKRQVGERMDALLNCAKKAGPTNDKLLDRRRRERLSEIYYVLLMSALLNKYNNGLIVDDDQNIDSLIKKVSIADDLDLFYVITELLEPPSLGEVINYVITDKSTFSDDGKSRVVLTLETFTQLALQVIASGNKKLDSFLLFRNPKRAVVMSSEEMEYQAHFTGKPQLPKARNAHKKAGHRGLSEYLIAHRDLAEEKVAVRREQLDREKHEDCSFEPIFFSKSSYRGN